MQKYSVYQSRIDTTAPASLVLSGATWDRVVSYLTCIWEMKQDHGLHAWTGQPGDKDRQSITVPWFSRMKYDIKAE